MFITKLQQELKTTARVTQAEKKDQMLEEMKNRVTTEEIELDKALYTTNKDVRKRFPDADKLLSEVGD